MRKLRVWLVALSAVVLVTGLVASVGAQSPVPAGDWAFVTGVETERECAEVTTISASPESWTTPASVATAA